MLVQAMWYQSSQMSHCTRPLAEFWPSCWPQRLHFSSSESWEIGLLDRSLGLAFPFPFPLPLPDPLPLPLVLASASLNLTIASSSVKLSPYRYLCTRADRPLAEDLCCDSSTCFKKKCCRCPEYGELELEGPTTDEAELEEEGPAWNEVGDGAASGTKLKEEEVPVSDKADLEEGDPARVEEELVDGGVASEEMEQEEGGRTSGCVGAAGDSVEEDAAGAAGGEDAADGAWDGLESPADAESSWVDPA